MTQVKFTSGSSTGGFRREVKLEQPPRRPVCDKPAGPDLGVDKCGRRRSRATDPEFRRGIKPANAGLAVAPGAASLDALDVLEAHPGRLAHGARPDAEAVQPLDLRDDLGRELGGPDLLAEEVRAAALALHVRDVLALGAEEQVGRVHTDGVVAVVADLHLDGRHLTAVGDCPRRAVGEHRLVGLLVDHEQAVALPVLRAVPFPTGESVAVFRHESPEALLPRDGGDMIGASRSDAAGPRTETLGLLTRSLTPRRGELVGAVGADRHAPIFPWGADATQADVCRVPAIIGAMESLDAVAARPAPAFAREGSEVEA